VLEIKLFGTPTFVFGSPLEDALPKRSLSVLAFLLLHRESELSRDRIAFELWPDVPEEDARAHLRRAFYTLQLWLPDSEIPWFVADRRHAHWKKNAPYRLDVEEFEKSLQAGRLAEAADLYTGDLLDTIEDEWIVRERDRYRDMELDALRRLVTQLRNAGDTTAAIAYAEKALRIDSWLESFVRDVMELRSLTGDRSSALREYRLFEEALKREMNASPEAETIQLFERIRAGEGYERPSQARAISNNLPAELSPLVGRQRDVELLETALRNYRLVSVVGAGGIGKSRLALRIGKEVTDRYADGVWFVEFAPISADAFIPNAIAAALSIHESPERSLRESILRTLASRRALLILDNCEHLIGAAAQCTEELLRHCPNLQIMITSSQPLNVQGEYVYRLGTLSFPQDCTGLTVEHAKSYSAIELFVQRARAAYHTFELTDVNAPAIGEICRRLDGIALAIELAAARVRVLSPSRLNEGLKARFRILTSGNRAGLPRHQTLGALIDWSYNLLDEIEKDLLRRVAVFVGSFSIEAASAICGAPESDDVDVLNTIASLVEKSLVVAEVGPVNDRYRLLESTREYLRQKLDELGERESTTRKVVDYYDLFVERAAREFHRTSPASWFSSIAAEYENIRAVLIWCLSEGRGPQTGAAIVGCLQRYWHDCGRPQEGSYWIDCALKAIDEEQSPGIAGRLYLAYAVLSLGEKKLQAAGKACVLLETADDAAGLGYALRQCALTVRIENPLEAEELCKRAADLMKAANDMGGLAVTLSTLASVIGERGDFESSRTMHEQALTVAKSHSADYAFVQAQLCLADSEYLCGNYAKAVARLEEAVSRVDPFQTAALSACLYYNLGAYRIYLGHYEEAADALLQSLAILRNAQDSWQVAITLQHAALVEALAGSASVAARLAGYVDAFYSSHSIQREPTEVRTRAWIDEVLRAQLAEAARQALFQEGAAMSEASAIALAQVLRDVHELKEHLAGT
jgi:predicted ATPase/DNA-binding SARP family transcriptional activator